MKGKFGAVILAAGSGNRFKGKKQMEILDGKTLWEHVLTKTEKVVSRENIVVVGIDVQGGDTRSKSVKIGLDNLSLDTDKVIILEAARPLVTIEQIETLLYDDSESSTFVLPLVNTIIKKDGEYVDRKDYLQLLTPQSFNFLLLKKAYDSGEYLDYTDETRVLFEHFKIKAKYFEGNDYLMKVTYPKDLSIIKQLYKEMKG